jgi:membrane protein required for beta-lactamase induction
MLEAVLLLLFCLFIGLLSLVIVIWLVVAGLIFNLDSLLLAVISLAVGGIFTAIFAWSVHTGEFQQILNAWKKKKSGADLESRGSEMAEFKQALNPAPNKPDRGDASREPDSA